MDPLHQQLGLGRSLLSTERLPSSGPSRRSRAVPCLDNNAILRRMREAGLDPWRVLQNKIEQDARLDALAESLEFQLVQHLYALGPSWHAELWTLHGSNFIIEVEDQDPDTVLEDLRKLGYRVGRMGDDPQLLLEDPDQVIFQRIVEIDQSFFRNPNRRPTTHDSLA